MKAKRGTLPYRDREVMTPWSTFTPLPSWQPQVSLQQGLDKLLQILK